MRMVIPALSFLLLLVVSSCQRELDIVPDDVNPPVGSDSTLLVKYVELDTTLLSGADTMYKLYFSYDNQKRLVNVGYFDYFLLPDIEVGKTEYFYSGNDTLAYKFVDTWQDGIHTFRDTIFLTYTNGLISRDSAIEYRVTTNEFWSTSVNYFTKTGNNIIVEKRKYNSPGITPPDEQWSGTLFQTYLNGNIIEQHDTAVFNPVNFNRAHHTASYDDKKNPFYDMDFRYPVLGRTMTSQKNNIIEEKTWDDGSFVLHFLWSYTYRQDGYPLTSILSEPGNPFLVKGLYFYDR